MPARWCPTRRGFSVRTHTSGARFDADRVQKCNPAGENRLSSRLRRRLPGEGLGQVPGVDQGEIGALAQVRTGGVGRIAQENDVPKGMLDVHWGDVAYNIALAASGGLAELVARGATAPRGTS